MAHHSRNSSSSSSGEDDNKIEYIGGEHYTGEQYLRLRWEVYYIGSYGINRDSLKAFLDNRFGDGGYALSLIGVSTYQLWAPRKPTEDELELCKETEDSSPKDSSASSKGSNANSNASAKNADK